MNPFVNPKKRSIQLPKGSKDLVDVLPGNRKRSCKVKCEYCGAPAVALTFMGMEDYRWCSECQQDLKAFAAMEIKIHFSKFKSTNIQNEAAVSRYRAEMERRQEAFMRQRVKGRKPK